VITALWVLVLFGFMAAVATFVSFAGGALVAWIADMQRERWGDE
jgi:hypothetical protein